MRLFSVTTINTCMSKIIKFTDAVTQVAENMKAQQYEQDIAALKALLVEKEVKYLTEKAKNEMIHLHGLEAYNNLSKLKVLLENSLANVDGILKIIENNT
jgi:hypothetical protein